MQHLVNRHLWRKFWDIALPYWRHEEQWKATGLLALLVALLLGQTGFAVLFNAQTGEFTSALAAHDSDRFWRAIRWCLALVAGAVPIYALYYFVRDTLGNLWRRWLTDRFLAAYFRDRHFYELNACTDIDNPDQRIAEDINTFTQRSLFFLLIFIGAALQLTAFSQVLWSIAHELVYFLVVYALAGTLLTVFVFGKPLIGLNFRQLQCEADLRFSLVRVREKAEPIALYHGEAQERLHVWQRFIRAFDNFRQLIRKQLFLNLFQYGYSMLTIVLPSALIASRVLSGELEVGLAIQAAGAFAAVLGAISVVIDNFEGLSRFAAGINRLDAFFKRLSTPPDPNAPQHSTIASVQDTRLALDQVTLQTPRHERTLIQNLSIDVQPGQGLLIVGASGSGKSSLLRALSGLWNAGSGTIFRPGAQDLLFLPQQPYMFAGTLRKQLLYPDLDRPATEAQLLDLLERVNLPDLAARFGGLDAERDWEKVLSIGEQQRLACARVLLVQPRFAILDEATSALDVDNETRLYQQLLGTRTTLVSVGHRTTLLAYHQHVLELTGDGHWRVHSAQGYQFGP